MKEALLLIDIQNDFCPGGALAVPDGDAIVPVVNSLMAVFDLVIATKDFHPPGHISFASRFGKNVFETIDTTHGPQILWPDHCIQESSGAQLHPRLNMGRIAKIIHKGANREIDSYSAFFDNGRQQHTELEHYLRQNDIKHLYLCGLATDYCVLFSALDALELGLAVTIVEDGCRGVNIHPDDSSKSIEKIFQKGGQCLQSQDIMKKFQGARQQ